MPVNVAAFCLLCTLFFHPLCDVAAVEDDSTKNPDRYLVFYHGCFNCATRYAILHNAIAANLQFCRFANVAIERRRNERLLAFSDFDVVIAQNGSARCVSTLKSTQISYIKPDSIIFAPIRRDIRNADTEGGAPDLQPVRASRSDPPLKYVDARCETGVDVLWRLGARAQHVRVAVFDTGLRRSTRYTNVVDITNWTNEPSAEDQVGHGTFMAGLIGASSDSPQSRCGPLAPEAVILVMKVFNSAHVSFTSWFLDAFNYALARRVQLINLSIGGPDYADRPFVDKVRELTANRVLLVSAIGNDGPLFGTLNNPADHPEVLGVGALELSGPSRTSLLTAPRQPARSDSVGQRRLAQRPGAGPPDTELEADHRVRKEVTNSSRNQQATSVRSRLLVTDFWTVARFSSRGMSMWQSGDSAPASYGRVKPDVLALGVNVAGRALDGGCRVLSGSSVASALTAGAVALLYGVALHNRSVDRATYGNMVNPSLLKQALLTTARRSASERVLGSETGSAGFSAFEQGAGAIDVLGAARLVVMLEPHVSLFPAALDLTDCPYFWPLCIEPLYYSRMPLSFNVTVLNSVGALATFERADIFTTDRYARRFLHVAVRLTQPVWPFAGHLDVLLSVSQHAANWTGVLTAYVNVTVRTQLLQSHVQTVTLPIRVRVVPTPARAKRVLFDTRHSIKYPPSYVPRDNLLMRNDPLDWNGDHPHTNLIEWFAHLHAAGYFVEVLHQSILCFNASLYGSLILFDSEADFLPSELQKLFDDITLHDLSLLVVADWYNVSVMRSLAFTQQNQLAGSVYRSNANHNLSWHPVTGGANVPALNELLAPFGIALGDTVLHGELAVSKQSADTDATTEFIDYESGSEITRFPADGHLLLATMEDQGSKLLRDAEGADTNTDPIIVEQVPILGLLQTGGGRIVVLGDSNCIDSAHSSRNCFTFFDWLLDYATSGNIAQPLQQLLVPGASYQFAADLASASQPQRPSWQPQLLPSSNTDCQTVAFQLPNLLEPSVVQRRELRDVNALLERGWAAISRLNVRLKSDAQLTASEKYFLSELRRLENIWAGEHSLGRSDALPARRHLDSMDAPRGSSDAPSSFWVLIVFFAYVAVFCVFLVLFVRKRGKTHMRQPQRASRPSSFVLFCSLVALKLGAAVDCIRTAMLGHSVGKRRRNPFSLPSPKATWLRSNVLRMRNLTRRTRVTPDRDRDRIHVPFAEPLLTSTTDGASLFVPAQEEQFRTASPNYVLVDDEGDREAGRSPSPS